MNCSTSTLPVTMQLVPAFSQRSTIVRLWPTREPHGPIVELDPEAHDTGPKRKTLKPNNRGSDSFRICVEKRVVWVFVPPSDGLAPASLTLTPLALMWRVAVSGREVFVFK